MPGTASRTAGPSYRPANVYLAQKQLPTQLRRIAVLPLTNRLTDFDCEAGREILQPILLTELAKTHQLQPNSLNDPQSIFSSPRRFGQYTIHAAFSTLPAR